MSKILICSRGHIWKTKTLADRFAHGGKKDGDRCPMVMAYDRVDGTRYCGRVLKEQKNNEKAE